MIQAALWVVEVLALLYVWLLIEVGGLKAGWRLLSQRHRRAARVVEGEAGHAPISREECWRLGLPYVDERTGLLSWEPESANCPVALAPGELAFILGAYGSGSFDPTDRLCWVGERWMTSQKVAVVLAWYRDLH